MKKEIKRILKERGKIELYSEERFELIKSMMKYAMEQDLWLKNYLSLDPLNKAEWCADHLIFLVEKEMI